MAKPLVFQWRDRQISFQMAKVDRARLYGFKESEVLDDAGQRCDLATLAQDGQTVVGRGGAAFGNLTVDGTWIEKGQMRPVDPAGQTIEPIPSSFAAPVPLVEKVSAEDYLDCAVRAIYVMETADDISGLREELAQRTIYRFPYSFRCGLEPDQGFLLANAEGTVFCAVGKPAKVEFLGLAQAAPAVEEEDANGSEEEADSMDFSMM
ncbi:MAG: hypothetical protein L0211_14460 [Planctomycetaceae bacterium]|nr:hypothetical protein [Planctomycetaceae bacterium]